MYVMKVYLDKQLMSVRHYNKFQNAFADIADENFTDDLSDEIMETLGKPQLYYASRDNDNMADDFEFRFNNNVIVYVGVIDTMD